MEKNQEFAMTELGRMVMADRRKARRWSIFFRSLWTLLFIVLAVAYVRSPEPHSDSMYLSSEKSSPHTALVKLHGPIFIDGPTSAEQINMALREAYANENSKAVVLEIDSPGGSPVQSGRIYDEIKHLGQLHPDKPLYVVIDDICASGGMYVAAAASTIYADQASIVGSIGVIAPGFGFVNLIEELGIERRVLTAGTHKALLDPFKAEDPAEVANIQQVLDDIHQQFIARVKEGRGDRLADNSEIFSGLVWTGEKAKELGLIDGFGSTRYVAEEIVGEKTIIEYRAYESLVEEFVGRFGSTLLNTIYSFFSSPRLQ